MNLETLAQLAGVSVGTVSKAFSGSGEISEKTRERIFTIARENGCFDKYNKNRFSKKVIAVLCPEVTSAYYTAILSLLEKEITAHGGICLVSVTSFLPEREKELFDYYASYCRADGVILVNQCARINNVVRTPAVSLMCNTRASQSCNIDRIDSDMSDSIHEAVAYLKFLGAERIGFVGEKKTSSKLTLFKKAMLAEHLNIDEHFIYISEHRFEKAGEDCANAWLAADILPQAVLAAYDYIAIGFIQRLKTVGLSVPQELSVIGMDDIPLAAYFDPPLSSIRSNTDEACRMAVELILKKIDNQYFSTRQRLSVPSELIVRGSCTKISSAKIKELPTHEA